jgi:transposase
MATTTMTHPQPASSTPNVIPSVIGGVDTHRDTHTAAALDATGRLLDTATFPATLTGYQQLLDWLRGFGPVTQVGVEGTNAYGVGLTRYLTSQQIPVLEVDRPDRRTRRARGKSDPIDAHAAARAVLAAERVSTPKHHSSAAHAGRIEALRALRVARRSAVEARKIVRQQIHALLVTAPEPLREQWRGVRLADLISACAGHDPRQDPAVLADPTRIGDPAIASQLALHQLARRHQHLSAEISDADTVITALITQINPTLLAVYGVGPDSAGQLLVTAGDNPARLRSEASFAHLCGVAPIPASSGRTDRHRLNRGGDRQANAALYRIVLSRLRWDARTRAYVERRTRQGLSKMDIVRCLKRYVAREVYTVLTSTNHAASTT